MTKRKRRLYLADFPCKRGHRPIRRYRDRVCMGCVRMRKRWEKMISRCYNPKDKNYKNYGGRGITVCDRWRNSFADWWDDIGHLVDGVPGATIDRRDNDRGYSPDNCRVADNKTQSRNKQDSIMITWEGVTKNLSEWCEELDLKYASAWNRRTNYPERGAEYVLFSVWVERTNTEVTIHRGNAATALKHWCKHLGCSIRTVEDRIYKFGWTYGQALGFSYRDGKCKPPPSI